MELLAREGSAGDWHFVCRKSDSGDDPRCSSSAATAEDAKFIMAQIWGDATASTASESVVGKAIEAEV